MDEGEEHALWRRWREQGDFDARNRLIGLYTPYARILAAQSFALRRHDDFEFPEYMQFALIGLLEAIAHYDPRFCVLFKTYAGKRIKGAILDWLERASERQQQVGLLRRVRADWLASIGVVSPRDAVSATVLRDLAEVGTSNALGFLLEGSTLLLHPMAETRAVAQDDLELRQLQQAVRTLIEQLNERQRLVIQLHYLEGKSFYDIAVRLGVSRARISQLHRQALLSLRALLARVRTADVCW